MQTFSDGRQRCANGAHWDACNWTASDGDALCLACQSNKVIPDLSKAGHLDRWREIESAKRRLFYSLVRMGLRRYLERDVDMPLTFAFMAAQSNQPVVTGHASGMVTLDVAEAESIERVRRREQLGEDYRTVLGHLRHEVGHFFWFTKFRDKRLLPSFRERFGREDADYGAALNAYYDNGPKADWPAAHISAYASSHPHEDWAETFAHYLHLRETMDTAAHERLIDSVDPREFDTLLDSWMRFSTTLNLIGRSMGYQDMYPFVLSSVVQDKLRYVHGCVVTAAQGYPAEASLNRAMAARTMD